MVTHSVVEGWQLTRHAACHSCMSTAEIFPGSDATPLVFRMPDSKSERTLACSRKRSPTRTHVSLSATSREYSVRATTPSRRCDLRGGDPVGVAMDVYVRACVMLDAGLVCMDCLKGCNITRRSHGICIGLFLRTHDGRSPIPV